MREVMSFSRSLAPSGAAEERRQSARRHANRHFGCVHLNLARKTWNSSVSVAASGDSARQLNNTISIRARLPFRVISIAFYCSQQINYWNKLTQRREKRPSAANEAMNVNRSGQCDKKAAKKKFAEILYTNTSGQRARGKGGLKMKKQKH